MMTEAIAGHELTGALLNNAEDIHAADETFAFGIITRPKKYRMVFYATRVIEYKQAFLKCFGMFDAGFIKRRASA